ncbi:hypothetical protein FOL47_010648 [Perkinsus chesapeaki]|uniref:Uncharacterized protein n=1 Tax=Perkinsus chesapeaki TaxID=330153 RepID=A0A7J6L233_PERCH|nr:hypothetical protein FOL47_010648 [Perkinsus chesapeaki]
MSESSALEASRPAPERLLDAESESGGLLRKYKRRPKRRDKPFMPAIVEETEEEMREILAVEESESHSAESITKRANPRLLRKRSARLNRFASGEGFGGIGADLDELQALFAHKAAAKASSDPSKAQWESLVTESTFIAALANELASPNTTERLVVAKFLHILGPCDAASAECFANTPKALELLVRFLKSGEDVQEYLPFAILSLAEDNKCREYFLKNTMNILAKLMESSDFGVVNQVCLATNVLAAYEDGATALVPEWGRLANLWHTALTKCGVDEEGNQSAIRLSATISFLFLNRTAQSMLVYKGALAFVLEALSEAQSHKTVDGTLLWLSGAVANLSSNPMNLKAMVDSRVADAVHSLAISTTVTPLEKCNSVPSFHVFWLRHSTRAQVRCHAAWTIAFLGANAGDRTYNNSSLSWVRDLLLLSDVDESADSQQVFSNSLSSFAFGMLTGLGPEYEHNDSRYLHQGFPQDCDIQREGFRYFMELVETEEFTTNLVEDVVALTWSDSERTRENALSLVASMYFDPHVEDIVVTMGGMETIARLAWTVSDESVKFLCSRCLLRFLMICDSIDNVQQHCIIRCLLILADDTSRDIRSTAIMGLWIVARSLALGNADIITSDFRAILVDTPSTSLKATLLDSARKENSLSKPKRLSSQVSPIECLVMLTRDAGPETQSWTVHRLEQLAAQRKLNHLSRLCVVRALSVLHLLAVDEVQEKAFHAYKSLLRTVVSEADLQVMPEHIRLLVDCTERWVAAISDINCSVIARQHIFGLIRYLVTQQPCLANPVCSSIGSLHAMTVILRCQSAQWGIDPLSTWHIFLAAVTSPGCLNSSELVQVHKAIIERIFDTASDMVRCTGQVLMTTEIPSHKPDDELITKLCSVGQLQGRLAAVKPVLDRTRSLPTVLSILHTRLHGLLDILQFNYNGGLVDATDQILRAVASVIAHHRESLDTNFIEKLLDILGNIMGAPRSNDLSEVIGVLQSLAETPRSRELLIGKGLINPHIVKAFLSGGSYRAIPRLFRLLKLCSKSEEAALQLLSFQEALIHDSMLVLDRAVEQESILGIIDFFLQFARHIEVANALRREPYARSVIRLLHRGSPAVCSCAIELLLLLADETSFQSTLVASNGSELSALDLVLRLATEGPRSVQSRAAWLVSSMTGENLEDAHYKLRVVEALMQLLGARNPAVLCHGLWGLRQIGVEYDEDVADKLVAINIIGILSDLIQRGARNNTHADWQKVRLETLQFVAHLAHNTQLKWSMATNSSILDWIVAALEDESPHHRLAASAAARSFAKDNPELARELCLLGICPKLLNLIETSRSCIAVKAMSELARAHNLVDELVQRSAVPGLLSTVAEQLAELAVEQDSLSVSTDSSSSVDNAEGSPDQEVSEESYSDDGLPLAAVTLVQRIAQVNQVTRDILLGCAMVNTIIIGVAKVAATDPSVMLEVLSAIRCLYRDDMSMISNESIEVLHTVMYSAPRHQTLKAEAEAMWGLVPERLRECFLASKQEELGRTSQDVPVADMGQWHPDDCDLITVGPTATM